MDRRYLATKNGVDGQLRVRSLPSQVAGGLRTLQYVSGRCLLDLHKARMLSVRTVDGTSSLSANVTVMIRGSQTVSHSPSPAARHLSLALLVCGALPSTRRLPVSLHTCTNRI